MNLFDGSDSPTFKEIMRDAKLKIEGFENNYLQVKLWEEFGIEHEFVEATDRDIFLNDLLDIVKNRWPRHFNQFQIQIEKYRYVMNVSKVIPLND